MKNHRSFWNYFVPLAVLSLGSLLAWAQASPPPQGGAQAAASPAKQAPTATPSPGERVFQANCGRCHNPPEQLSPRITGTVLRHMRVRALLSPQDERDLLKFLAP
jgi:mono/diheme cytochrome c family protein